MTVTEDRGAAVFVGEKNWKNIAVSVCGLYKYVRYPTSFSDYINCFCFLPESP